MWRLYTVTIDIDDQHNDHHNAADDDDDDDECCSAINFRFKSQFRYNYKTAVINSVAERLRSIEDGMDEFGLMVMVMVMVADDDDVDDDDQIIPVWELLWPLFVQQIDCFL